MLLIGGYGIAVVVIYEVMKYAAMSRMMTSGIMTAMTMARIALPVLISCSSRIPRMPSASDQSTKMNPMTGIHPRSRRGVCP